MDFNTLRDQVSNLTIYDLKAGVRKVQNGQLLDQSMNLWRLSLWLMISCNEFYGDGGEGPRGYEQWAVGSELE